MRRPLVLCALTATTALAWAPPRRHALPHLHPGTIRRSAPVLDAPLPPPGTRLSEQLFFELCGERMAATEASCVAVGRAHPNPYPNPNPNPNPNEASCVAELTKAGMKEAYVGKVRRRANPNPNSNP